MLRLRPSVITITQEDMDEFHQRRTQLMSPELTRHRIPRKPTCPGSMRPLQQSDKIVDVINMQSSPERKVVITAPRGQLVRVQSYECLSTLYHESQDENEEEEEQAKSFEGALNPAPTFNQSPGLRVVFMQQKPPRLRRSLTTTSIPRILGPPESFPPRSSSTKLARSRTWKQTTPAQSNADTDDDPVSGQDVPPPRRGQKVLPPASNEPAANDLNDCDARPPLWSSPLDALIQRLRAIPTTPSTISRGSPTSPCTSTPLLSGGIFYGPDEPPNDRHQSLSPTAYSAAERIRRAPHVQQLRRSPHLHPHDRNSSEASCPDVSPARILANDNIIQLGNVIVNRSPPHTHVPTSLRRPNTTMHDPSKTPRTPRVKVYDDEMPAVFQPQTPADLYRPRRDQSSIRHPPFIDSRNIPGRPSFHPAFIPHGESRYPSPDHLHAPTSTNRHPDGSHRQTSQERSRVIRARQSPGLRYEQENTFEPLSMGMAGERNAWLAGRGGEAGRRATLENTPPQQGRFEHLLPLRGVVD